MSEDLYDHPQVYDAVHAPGTRAEVDGLERIAAQFLGRGDASWIEPACGTGRYLIEAARRGRFCIGFDLSPSMVEYARGRARRAGVTARCAFDVADMTDFSVPSGRRFRFAFNPINTIRHLKTDGAVIKHLNAMARAVGVGGVYAIGLSLCAYGVEVPSEDVWKARRAGRRYTQTIQYLPPEFDPGRPRQADRAERVISHIAVEGRGRAIHLDSTYTLRGYNEKQWRAVVGRSAMRIEAVTDERGEDLPLAEPGYGVFILRAVRRISV